jgi:Flp pilus assembly pilin Flp
MQRVLGMLRLRRFLKDRSITKVIEYSMIAVAVGVAVAVVVLEIGNPLDVTFTGNP